VARLGGDEFALLVPLPRGRGLARDTISRTLETFAVPIEVARRMLYVSPSIGVAYYPADGRDASALLERADAEMYKVKTRRRAARGDQGATTLPLEPTQDIEVALRRAINEERLVLHYQPKVDLTTGRATGVEALLRWRHPAGGLLLPQDFLPIAEENGMMPALAEWVLLEACAQSRRWLDFNVAAVRVAVNLSPSQLKAGRVPELVERVLRFTKLPPELLELEVDERATQLHVETLRADLVALRDLGVRCVIDDFGGVGSLQYLEDLPFDAIELGRRHARAITAGGGRVVTAALAMGRALGIETVVEGVETPDQLAFLQEHGCAIAQGHLLGGPAAGDEIEHYLTGLVSEGPAIRAVNEP
jgi:predicted signal transduction protein with EAL and GGDEF domain